MSKSDPNPHRAPPTHGAPPPETPPQYSVRAACAQAPGPYGTPTPAQRLASWEGGRLYPEGLKSAFLNSADQFAHRFWIVDNSGSMASGDGKIMQQTSGNRTMVSCSRWTELRAALRFHGETAIHLRAPTHFLLLNQPIGAPQRIVVGDRTQPVPPDAAGAPAFIEDPDRDDMSRLNALCRTEPTGGTPLCAAIRSVTAEIRALAPSLSGTHQRVVLVIASDGAASDGDVAAALAALRGLPVWVVIRLCTDDESVVQYWNEIDGEVELDMDVLDDLEAESAEIHDHSPWLTYGLPLHRLREWGTANKVIDVLDERRLAPHELIAIVQLIYGDRATGDIPHPITEWELFQSRLDRINQSASSSIWDPTRGCSRHWVKNGAALRRTYHPSSCSIL